MPERNTSAQLPEGSSIRPAGPGAPPENAEVYEWEVTKRYDELPAAEVVRRAAEVTAEYDKWSEELAKLYSAPEDLPKRDEQARKIMLAVHQPSIDFSRRFPHLFKQLTDHELAKDQAMRKHHAIMLKIFAMRQEGTLSENEARKLVSQLAQQTIKEKTAALPPEELARRRRERAKEMEGMQRMK
jgi:hypothetical protein